MKKILLGITGITFFIIGILLIPIGLYTGLWGNSYGELGTDITIFLVPIGIILIIIGTIVLTKAVKK